MIEDDQVDAPAERPLQFVREVQVKPLKCARRILIEEDRDVDVAARCRLSPRHAAEQVHGSGSRGRVQEERPKRQQGGVAIGARHDRIIRRAVHRAWRRGHASVPQPVRAAGTGHEAACRQMNRFTRGQISESGTRAPRATQIGRLFSYGMQSVHV